MLLAAGLVVCASYLRNYSVRSPSPRCTPSCWSSWPPWTKLTEKRLNSFFMVGMDLSLLVIREYLASDDMCHLAPYSRNVLKKKKNRTELTEFFSSRKLAVDFLHFKVFIDNYAPVQYKIILESCWS